MKLDHEFRLAAPPDHRVSFLVDSQFAVYTAKGEKAVDHVGPPSAITRQAAVTVPEGCDGIIVKTPKGACLTLLDVRPCRTKEVLDSTKHPEYVSADMVPDQVESVANQIARALFLRGELKEPPETFEEANDFDMDDEEDFPFEVEFRRMVEETVDVAPVEDEPTKAAMDGSESDPEPAGAALADSEASG